MADESSKSPGGRICLIFTGLLCAALLPSTAWTYDNYGYPGDRGYQPYPGAAAHYQSQRRGSLRLEKGTTEEGYYVRVYLDGLQPDEIQVFVRRNRLVLQSAQDDEYGQLSPGSQSFSRSHRHFRKQVQLPYDADGTRITTDAKDGVMEIYIPRAGQHMPSRPFPEK